MEFEFEHKHDDYPDIWNIRIDGKNQAFYLISSPFGNCQTSCLNYAQCIIDIPNEDIGKFLRLVIQKVPKRQMFIDLKEMYSESVLDKLKPYMKNVISTPYESTNGSKMIMHLIQWDVNILDL